MVQRAVEDPGNGDACMTEFLWRLNSQRTPFSREIVRALKYPTRRSTIASPATVSAHASDGMSCGLNETEDSANGLNYNDRVVFMGHGLQNIYWRL